LIHCPENAPQCEECGRIGEFCSVIYISWCGGSEIPAAASQTRELSDRIIWLLGAF
jgi:hypothetical protein